MPYHVKMRKKKRPSCSTIHSHDAQITEVCVVKARSVMPKVNQNLLKIDTPTFIIAMSHR